MSTSLAVRPARVEDAVQMARVNVRCWQETYRGLVPDAVLDDPGFVDSRERFWTAALTDERFRANRVAVAEREGNLIGIAMSGPPLDAGVAWRRQLYVLYVVAVDHGTGAGRALLEAVVDPEESVALWVADPNPRAQAFYRKHGFAADGATQVDGGVREIRMVRRPSGAYGRCMTTNTITLNNGVTMPILGFGVFQIPAEDTEQAVSDALAAGYRHIDTAAAYLNEEAVGRAIAASGIAREDLFVTTKVWTQDAGEDATAKALDTSLRKLGLDHVDLYLIHQPYGDYYGSWRAMRASSEEGLAKAIGVANFHEDRLVDLIERTGVTPAVNQIETHPYFQRADYHNLMAERGVQHQSWGGFAEGRNNIFSDPVLTEIGNAHGKSVAQVVLRWLTQSNVVAIPKSVRPERMAENIDIFDFTLTSDEMTRIAGLDTGTTLFFDHRDPAMVAAIGGARIHD